MNLFEVASTDKEPHAFVLRLWFEPTASTGPEGEWRGRITDAVSLEQRYFRGLSDLTRYLAERTGMPDGIDDTVEEVSPSS
jgi:hypothetical protein